MLSHWSPAIYYPFLLFTSFLLPVLMCSLFYTSSPYQIFSKMYLLPAKKLTCYTPLLWTELFPLYLFLLLGRRSLFFPLRKWHSSWYWLPWRLLNGAFVLHLREWNLRCKGWNSMMFMSPFKKYLSGCGLSKACIWFIGYFGKITQPSPREIFEAHDWL